MTEMALETLGRFWAALGILQAYFEIPTVPYDDPIFCIRTKPGFIFDDSFWEVFHAYPLIICHVAYYGPERLEGGDRHSDEGIFELRFAFTGTRLGKCPTLAAGEEAMTEMTPERFRETLDGRRTDGKHLSKHMQETASAPWLGEPFDSIAECDLSWKSMLEHEAIEVGVLEDAGYAAVSAWEADRKEREELRQRVIERMERNRELNTFIEVLKKWGEAAEQALVYAATVTENPMVDKVCMDRAVEWATLAAQGKPTTDSRRDG